MFLLAPSTPAGFQDILEPCSSFAFRNGNYTAELAQHAIRCGLQTVMTTEPTWTDHAFPLWRVPRLQLLGTDSRTKIERKTAVATARRILSNPDGTGRVDCAINNLARTRSKDFLEPLRNGKVAAAKAKL